MKLDTNNVGPLMVELRKQSHSTAFVVRAGGKDYVGAAVLTEEKGRVVLEFTGKHLLDEKPKAPRRKK